MILRVNVLVSGQELTSGEITGYNSSEFRTPAFYDYDKDNKNLNLSKPICYEILSTLTQAEYDLEELDKRLAVERRNELKQQTNEYLEGRYN